MLEMASCKYVDTEYINTMYPENYLLSAKVFL